MDDTISEIPSVELNMEQFEDHDADDGGSGDDSGGESQLTADDQVNPVLPDRVFRNIKIIVMIMYRVHAGNRSN